MIERSELSERERKLFDTLVFMTKFLAVGLVFQVILWIYPDTSSLQAGFAVLINQILDLLGFDFVTRGTYIISTSVDYVITQDCLGWKSMMAYIGLMFASSEDLRAHLKALAGGLGVIAVANVVRVVTTIYLSHMDIISWDIIHGLLWKWGLTAVVLVVWFYWFRYYRRE
ncbi:MAG: archaeosortase/exosortase family protein [Candidatus Nanohaloarchaea archaeon]